MLGKLLKYDLKYVLKYWWIAAVTALALSFLGGGCIAVVESPRPVSQMVEVMVILLLVLIIFSQVAFSLLTSILMFVRYYKNFFSDEGYLTFTLPVKKGELLNSKLITGVLALFATLVMIAVNALIMLSIGFGKDFWDGFSLIVESLWKEIGFYMVVYIVEIILLLLAVITFTTLFTFCCITFASIITKKARVITAIGIYYGANSILSFLVQIFYYFGLLSLSVWIEKLDYASIEPIVALILLTVVMFVAVFCGLLYILQYWMLDRKLNMA